MSEGESDAMEAYEEEEIETDERGRKKMPSIDRLAREAVVNRWGGNRAVPAPHSPSLMTPHLLRQSCRTCLSIHPAMGTQTSGLCVFVHTLVCLNLSIFSCVPIHFVVSLRLGMEDCALCLSLKIRRHVSDVVAVKTEKPDVDQIDMLNTKP
jgi:hypothetical protein